ncbi:MAG: hypothetical protein K2G32_05945, partial [Oscillospiraceae bacterium]|nr:hypothetical protein [Oscillospiraceae bacterium]
MSYVKRTASAVCAVIVAVLLWAAFLCAPAYADASYGAVLVDLDSCIPDSKEAELTEYMQRTAELIECNIGVVITADLNGKTDVGYSEGFLNDNFGRGSSSVVLLLLNTHDKPEYSHYTDQISLDGRGYEYYDRRTDKIFDRLYDGLDSSGFEEAVRDFCRALVSYKGSSGAHHVEFTFDFTYLVGALVIGLVIAYVITYNVSKGYTKKASLSAVNYLDKNRTTLTRKTDVFVREYTRTYTNSSSSSGGHSGGGGHSSHSG